ncbi:MAG: alpha/beta hydrolase [Chloroflexi bacterium]|nr:alpha/beta hydrolase [Chloroflexota bacterium]
MIYGVAGPTRLGTSGLPDGRGLGWAEWGPENGRPILFFSGAAMGRSLGFGADVLAQHDARLIAVDRPGLGVSDPDSGRTLNDWARDVESLTATLGLADVRIVGFSQGAPFALACAAASIPRAVAIVSGQDDLRHAAFAELLHPDVAALVGAVDADPASVEASFAESADAEMLWHLIVGSSGDLDTRVYTSPAFEPAFRHALAEGFAQGPAGYVRDLVLALGRWPFTLSDIRATVDLWYGGQDASPVHSPDYGATLARRISTAHRHLVRTAGGSLLWTHADAILTALLAAK